MLFDLLSYLIVALVAWHVPRPPWAKAITDVAIRLWTAARKGYKRYIDEAQ